MGENQNASSTGTLVNRLTTFSVCYKKVKTEKESRILSEEIRTLVNEEQWNQLEAWCCSTMEKICLDSKAKQIQKFEHLQAKQHVAPPQLDQDKVVKSLSSRSLAPKEKEALALGLNVAVTPQWIPTFEIIAATEATASQLESETAQLLRHRVSSILSTAKPPRSNLSGELQKAVKNLREDRNIVILPADKGNATVILDQADYAAKMEHFLEDRAYKKVQRNPTSRVEAMVSTALKGCERKGHITSKKCLTLAHQFSSPPQIYGLPKIHKEGIPLRPIVAAIGSPTHQLARELARILSLLAGRSPSHVKNSAYFVNHIRHVSFEGTDVLASFDVVSLFTRVPVDEAFRFSPTTCSRMTL